MAYAVQVRKYFKLSRNIFRKLENKYDSEIYINKKKVGKAH